MTGIKPIVSKSLAVLAVLLILLPAALVLSYDGELSTLLDEAFEPHQRPPSIFGHDEHMDYEGLEECYVCHHLYEDGQLVPEESSDGAECSECHQVDPGDGSTRLLMAYHQRCQGCHEDRGQGPRACGECHVK